MAGGASERLDADSGNTVTTNMLVAAADGTNSLTLTAHYTREKYTLTWVGGTVPDGTAAFVYSTDPTITLPTPAEKEGYTFAGWKADTADNPVYELGDSPTVGQDTTFTAQWTANEYNISLDYNDDLTAPTKISGTYGQEIGANLIDLTRDGYTFCGWWYQGTTRYYADTEYNIADDVILVAVWIKLNPISAVTLTGYIAPVIGATITRCDLNPGSTAYKAKLTWYDSHTGTVATGGTFISGRAYYAEITVTATDSNTFADRVDYTLAAVKDGTATLGSGTTRFSFSTGTIYPTVTEISRVPITDLVAPVTGATPDPEAAISTSISGMTDYSPHVTWEYDSNGWYTQNNASKFVSATSYSATMVIDALNGYIFATSPTVTVSGASSVSKTVSNGGTRLTVVVTYTVTPSGGGSGSSSSSARLSPKTAGFDRNPEGENYDDITVALSRGSYSVKNILLDGNVLVSGTDYTMSGSKCTFTAEFLAALDTGKHEITFAMSGGTDPVLTITVEDSTKPWVNPFTDVFETDWFYDDVQYVHINGLFMGTSETTFSPQMTMTRGMLVTVLGRLEGVDIASFTDSGFKDVNAQRYYAPYVAWARANGIVDGYSSTSFGPNDSITREQMAAIFYRYAQYKGYDTTATTDLSGYTDAYEISSWALAAIKWANAEGLVKGKSDTEIVPGDTAARAETAAVFHRFMENIAR